MTEKKIDARTAAKTEVMDIVGRALIAAGYSVEDGAEYGTTAGTIIVHGKDLDVKVKPIAPKKGVTRYSKAESEKEGD